MMSRHTSVGNASKWKVPSNNLALAESFLRHLISDQSPRPPLDLPSPRSAILLARPFLPVPLFIFPLLLLRPSSCPLRSGRRAGRCEMPNSSAHLRAGAPQDEAMCSSALVALFLTAHGIPTFYATKIWPEMSNS